MTHGHRLAYLARAAHLGEADPWLHNYQEMTGQVILGLGLGGRTAEWL